MSVNDIPPNAVEWHYVMTMQTSTAKLATISGTVWVENATRAEVYQHVLARAVDHIGARGPVLFYTADHNDGG
ncbi:MULTISPECIES: hypothetical protein [Streptomyces]|uniref:hypothetical protein n=1 Tax=Streptomyces TaxID=1883 RepID=UPI0004BD51B3|nr:MULTISPECIES: hypothetical protein [Streptomyces]MZE79729.1 hypothetical protein [Streptomyces sp. SID5475]